MKTSPKIFVVAVVSIVISLSIFTMTNSNNSNNNNAYAQQDGFTQELNLLNQSITTLENQDKNAKKTLFDAEEIIEEKMKDNPDIVNAEKRVEAAIKMVSEDNFQSAIEHTNEAIKTLSELNNK
ncbi:MAG TPA: hypothetical protein VJ583_11225 [Nitrososphaeraceae archaeon]|nr:hypothetical protein [Nitrososphaeraceae archaeon]